MSPLLANIYLDLLDKELERRGVSFVRYADDIAIFASSRRSADRILDSVIRWIEKCLKVPVNQALSNKTLKRYGFFMPWDFAEASP